MAVDRKEFLSSLVMLEKPVSLNEIAMLTGVSYVTTGLIVKEMIRKENVSNPSNWTRLLLFMYQAHTTIL